jgi:hypothetical protein
MSTRAAFSAILLTALLGSLLLLRAQNAPGTTEEQAKPGSWNNGPPPKKVYAGKKSAPAPRHDLSGIWNAAAEGGVQAKGVLEHPALFPDHPQDDIGEQPDESKIPRPLSYTPSGLAALKGNKPGVGVRAVGPGLVNDPVDFCDPQGFPRMELFEFRVMEITQNKNQIMLLYQFYDNWRLIWTDGRALPDPKEAEPRWNGYSVGKWADDYTFVVDTVGMNEKTWLDNAGRPHSADLTVQERFHRVDYDTLELTVTINDPKFYAQPWQALNKFVLHRLPDDYDIQEFFCVPSETEDYNKLIGTPASIEAPKK